MVYGGYGSGEFCFWGGGGWGADCGAVVVVLLFVGVG